MSSLSTSLKNSYQKWLCPYEEYLRVAKPGVHQQLELEYGGPFTPSPAPSPMKRSNVNTPSSMRPDSPARHATDALQMSVNGHVNDSDRDTPMADASPLAPPQMASGFTAINSGGFTAVNSGFTSVNRPLAAAEPKGLATPKQFGSPVSSAKNTPEYRPSSLGTSHPLKRQLSCESIDSKKDSGNEKDDNDPGSRRSKRLKKGKSSNHALRNLPSSKGQAALNNALPHSPPVMMRTPSVGRFRTWGRGTVSNHALCRLAGRIRNFSRLSPLPGLPIGW